MLTRERYREDLDRAYEVQFRAGVEVCILMYRKNWDSGFIGYLCRVH